MDPRPLQPAQSLPITPFRHPRPSRRSTCPGGVGPGERGRSPIAHPGLPCVRGSKRYWVRLGSETVDAELHDDLLRGLIEQTARVPWDDRRAPDARSRGSARSKGPRIPARCGRSGLLDEPNARERLSAYANHDEGQRSRDRPGTRALLFFSKDPAEWFRGAKIEVVQFAADRAGDVQEERVFSGALVDQLRDCLNYLENFSAFHSAKAATSGAASAAGSAIRCRRCAKPSSTRSITAATTSTSPNLPRSISIRTASTIISYPGPVAGIEARHLLPDAEVQARACPQSPHRRIPEGTGACGGTAHRAAEGVPGDGNQRLSVARDSISTNSGPTSRPRCRPIRSMRALSALRDAAHLRTHWGSTGKRSAGSKPHGTPTRLRRCSPRK